MTYLLWLASNLTLAAVMYDYRYRHSYAFNSFLCPSAIYNRAVFVAVAINGRRAGHCLIANGN